MGSPAADSEISLEYPLRPDLLAQVVIPRDLTVEEARRMGAFLVTLAVDFRPPCRADKRRSVAQKLGHGSEARHVLTENLQRGEDRHRQEGAGDAPQ